MLAGAGWRRRVTTVLSWVASILLGTALVRAVEGDLLLLEQVRNLEVESGELMQLLSDLENRSPRRVYAFDSVGHRASVHSFEELAFSPSNTTILFTHDGRMVSASYVPAWWPAYEGAFGVIAYDSPQCSGQRYFCPHADLALGDVIVIPATTEPVVYEMYLLPETAESRAVIGASYENIAAGPECIAGSADNVQDVCFPLPDLPDYRDVDLEMVLPVTFGVLR